MCNDWERMQRARECWVGNYYLFRVFTGAELGFATEVRCAMSSVG